MPRCCSISADNSSSEAASSFAHNSASAAVGVSGTNPAWIAKGPDGALGFTDGYSVGSMTTAGAITRHKVPDVGIAQGIAAGPGAQRAVGLPRPARVGLQRHEALRRCSAHGGGDERAGGGLGVGHPDLVMQLESGRGLRVVDLQGHRAA